MFIYTRQSIKKKSYLEWKQKGRKRFVQVLQFVSLSTARSTTGTSMLLYEKLWQLGFITFHTLLYMPFFVSDPCYARLLYMHNAYPRQMGVFGDVDLRTDGAVGFDR